MTDALFPAANVPPAYFRADIARRYAELFALGWLGRAYAFAPPLFEKLLPRVFCLEPYDDDGAAFAFAERDDGSVDVVLKESSVVARGIPFHLRLADDLSAASLRGIGCDLAAVLDGSDSRGSGGDGDRLASSYDEQRVRVRALSERLNADRAAKRRVVRAISSTIFRELTPVKQATKSDGPLEACGAPTSFVPKRELWAREGSSEKWCQQVSGYYFAEATLQDVRYAGLERARFSFYYDATEPINSDDPYRNVNPEVIFCAFDEGA